MNNFHSSIDSRQVALAHDAMANEYDQMNDLWYPWLFAQIHEFIAANLPTTRKERPAALDVGCGTGLQSFLLARAGYEVTAFDLAGKLVDDAIAKIPHYAGNPLSSPPLFESESWSGAHSHHERLAALLEDRRLGRDPIPPRFFTADINDFDFGKQRYDVIVCCGSVLSFLDNYDSVIEKMAGGLNDGGVLFLEVEQKRNFDLVWPIIDNLSGGKLGYEQSWSEIWRNLFSPRGKSVKVDYPFELQDGQEVILPIWLFSVNELQRLFKKNGLRVNNRLGVHWLTNLVPSTVLHNAEMGMFIKNLSERLIFLDGIFCRLWPMWRSGCSAIYCLERKIHSIRGNYHGQYNDDTRIKGHSNRKS